jgi:hypothetical protein
VLGLSAPALLIVILIGHNPAERSALWPQSVSFAVVLALPSTLAFLSLASRPTLLLAAGVVGLPIGSIAWSAAPLVWIPSILFLLAYVRRPARAARPWAPRVLLVFAVLLAGVGSVAALIDDTHPACWSYVRPAAGEPVYRRLSAAECGSGMTLSGRGGNGIVESGGGSGQVPSGTAMLGSTALVAAALAAGWALAAPRLMLNSEPG